MNLLGCVRLSNWTGENIQSYERENTFMQLTVFGDENAFHETHVCLKCQFIRESRTSSGAADSVLRYESLEIRDL